MLVYSKMYCVCIIGAFLVIGSACGMEKAPRSQAIRCQSPKKYSGDKAEIPFREPYKETFDLFMCIDDDCVEAINVSLQWNYEKLKNIQWHYRAMDVTLLEYAQEKSNPQIIQKLNELKKICDNLK